MCRMQRTRGACNAVNFSPWVARSNLFGRVGTHFSPEIELFSSHARNNHLTLYEKSDYENIAIKKFTVSGAMPMRHLGMLVPSLNSRDICEMLY